MNTIAILQARMTSQRLPGKVLKKVLNKPMLQLQIERIKRARLIDRLVVATGNDKDNDPIEALCNTLGVICFRGSLHDVLDRFYQCANLYAAKNVIRLTGDCPLISASVIDALIESHQRTYSDFSSNTIRRFFPDGLDTEVMTMSLLTQVWQHTTLNYYREHVTSYIMDNLRRYRCFNLPYYQDFSHLRWTLDTKEDFKVIKYIFETLYPKNANFSFTDVLNLYQDKKHLKKLLLNQKKA